ncbi:MULTISPECIES: PD-(D/E)XK nuclease family protein [Glaesserella]|uniref:PD-(D/E)XK nuclease family protein n=1 Tax=Glaesserella TaxID=2094023 RepID=UPI001CA5E6E4|nr:MULTISPECIES: PD-(D/E)XK nuclease family protein [Glaesserella]
MDTDRVYVDIHKATYQNRYHDIFIQIYGDNAPNPKLIISIESKLRWASDQPRQVSHYIDDIKKYNPDDYLMLYLIPKGNTPPTENSISRIEWDKEAKIEKAKVICIANLIEWLEESKPKANNVQVFVEHFIHFFKQEYIMTEKQDKKIDVIAEFLTNQQTSELESLFNIIESKEMIYSVAKERIINKFNDKLNEFYKKTDIALDDQWSIDDSKSISSKGYISPIYFTNKIVNFVICIEGTKNSAYWGIKREDQNSDEEILNILKTGIKSSSPTDKYPLWNYINSDFDSPRCWADFVTKDSYIFESIWNNIEKILNVYHGLSVAIET